MTDNFYYGLHPVSWFILLANLAVTIFEWQFLISQFRQLSAQQKEKESKVGNWEASVYLDREMVGNLFVVT